MSSSLKAAMALVTSTLLFSGALSAQEPPGYGPEPKLPAPAETWIPTIKWSVADEPWPSGATPKPAPGLQVRAFAQGLKHPRWMLVLPNGDVLVAEAASEPAKTGWSPRAIVQNWAQRRSGSTVENANRISILRDGDGDGVAETQAVFLEGLRQPFGMALVGDNLYVANTDSVVRFPFHVGETRITDKGTKLLDLPVGHHWTRTLLPSADGSKLFVTVGSGSNIGEKGMDIEKDRATILQLDLATGQSRIFASGLRNANGMAIEPTTGALWTVVNERDELGDDLPPDYLTSVKDGGILWMAVQLLGQERRHASAAAAARSGRNSSHTRLCPGWTHSIAGARLLQWRPAARAAPRGHVYRPARLLEPHAIQRLQGRIRAVQRWPAQRSASRRTDGLPQG